MILNSGTLAKWAQLVTEAEGSRAYERHLAMLHLSKTRDISFCGLMDGHGPPARNEMQYMLLAYQHCQLPIGVT